MIVAASAVLISAASFVATYIQSEAALRQVTAETWPFLQIDHGNVTEEDNLSAIYFTLGNAGVGPARIKKFNLFYEGERIQNFDRFVYDCCAPEGLEYPNLIEQRIASAAQTVTDNVPPIIPDGEEVRLFYFPYNTDWSEDSIWPGIWRRVDDVRWKVTASACYCSLLEECYQTNFIDDPVEVDMCLAASDKP